MAFNKTWKFNVIAGGGLTENDVFSWIQQARIPLWFDFQFSPEKCKWHVDCSETYGCWPKPDYEWTFIVVRPTNITNGLHMKNASGLGWPEGFCVTADFGEDPETLGLRIWHEALHSMSSNSDMLNPGVTPNDIESFRNFVETSDLFRNDATITSFLNKPINHPNNAVLRAYYYFKMQHDLGCPALPLPPVSPSPPATISLLERFMKWFLRLFGK